MTQRIILVTALILILIGVTTARGQDGQDFEPQAEMQLLIGDCIYEIGQRNASDNTWASVSFTNPITVSGEKSLYDAAEISQQVTPVAGTHALWGNNIVLWPVLCGRSGPDPEREFRVSWTAPMYNEDGSITSDLAGFRLYCSGQDTITINDPSATEVFVPFAWQGSTCHMTAFDESGNESRESGQITLER